MTMSYATTLLLSLLAGLAIPTIASAQAPQGMEPHVLVVLKTGPAYNATAEAERNEHRQAHGMYLMGLLAKGTAVTLGPFTEETRALGGAIGFVLLRVASKDEANAIMKQDPTISRGIFSYELVGVLIPTPAKAPDRLNRHRFCGLINGAALESMNWIVHGPFPEISISVSPLVVSK
jgi:uncharacterized protein YciI